MQKILKRDVVMDVAKLDKHMIKETVRCLQIGKKFSFILLKLSYIFYFLVKIMLVMQVLTMKIIHVDQPAAKNILVIKVLIMKIIHPPVI